MARKYEGTPRERQNQASRDWKRRNREHTKAKLAEWLAKNSEHRRRYCSERYQRRKHIESQQSAERYLRPENVAKRAARREEKRVYMRQWVKDNPHRIRAAHAKRKALKRNNPVGDVAVIASWFARWRSMKRVKCYWCLAVTSPENCHGDHIIPLAKGGAHAIDNLCVSCGDCNRRKHDRTPSVWNRFLPEPVLL